VPSQLLWKLWVHLWLGDIDSRFLLVVIIGTGYLVQESGNLKTIQRTQFKYQTVKTVGNLTKFSTLNCKLLLKDAEFSQDGEVFGLAQELVAKYSCSVSTEFYI